MQSDVIAKIDALVKMSDSQANVNTMKVELREIDCSIKEKRIELKELESSITDDKYFDASGEIVDKNIEISLTKKLKSLKKSLNELLIQIDKVNEEESRLYKNVEDTKKNIDESEKFLEILETKMSFADSSLKENFNTLYKEVETKLKNCKKTLSKDQKAYEKVQGKLEVLSFSKNELNEKIESETEKLIDVKSNLLNKRGYVNSELKKHDEEEIKSLENDIKELEVSRNKIISNPVMIAEDAKNFLIDDDKTSALKKIKELRDSLLSQPYMDIDSTMANDTLSIELENVEAKRDELASMINSKSYESADTTLIKDRINYIKSKKERYLNDIVEIEDKIKEADTILLNDLNDKISACEEEVDSLKDKIEEYSETINNSDLTSAKKALLQASFEKKQDELNNVIELLNSYREDRKTLIIKTYNLQEQTINEINDKIEEIDNEAKVLEKLAMSSSKGKDTIAMENDKKALRELNDNIKSIKKRQGMKSTPNEIYDEIELLIGASQDINIETIEENEDNDDFQYSMPSIDDNDETIFVDDSLNDSIDELNIDRNEEDISDFIINDEEPSLDYIDDYNNNIYRSDDYKSDESDNDIDTIDIDSLNIIEDDFNKPESFDNINEEKLKVINVEPLEDNNEDLNDEFLIGDYSGE